MRVILAAFYLIGGVANVLIPDSFLPIVPDSVPYPREIVLLTGICEIAGAIGLLTKRFRWWAGVALAVYAACVFPANLKHAFEGVVVPPLSVAGGITGRGLRFSPF